MATLKTTSDYYKVLKDLCSNLGIQGISSEILSRLLAQSLYFSEVENVAYSQEASLERASQYNSKIQLSADRMYSVFRGTCPRVFLHFYSQDYFSFNIFDKIITQNSFDIYYLGYVDDSTGKFIYSPTIIAPTDEDYEYTIIGLVSPKLYEEENVITDSNTTYTDILESDLSNDIRVFVKLGEEEEIEEKEVTRIFADHIYDPENRIFDLTIPDLGSRLYAPEIFKKGMTVYTKVFKYCELDDFTSNELTSLSFPGAELIPFTDKFLINNTEFSENTQLVEKADGIIYIDAVNWDEIKTIHYKANKERFSAGIVKSNSDIGYVLKEYFPDRVKEVTYKFSGSSNSVEKISLINDTYTFLPLKKEGNLFMGDMKVENSDYSIPEVSGYSGVSLATGIKITSNKKIYDRYFQFTENITQYPWSSKNELSGNIMRIKLPNSLEKYNSLYDIDNSTSLGKFYITHSGIVGTIENLNNPGSIKEFGGNIFTGSESISEKVITFPFPVYDVLTNGTNVLNFISGTSINNKSLCWYRYIPAVNGKLTLSVSYSSDLVSNVVCYSDGEILIGEQGIDIEDWSCSKGLEISSGWNQSFPVSKGIPIYFSGIFSSGHGNVKVTLDVNIIESNISSAESSNGISINEGSSINYISSEIINSEFDIYGNSGYVYVYGAKNARIYDISFELSSYRKEVIDAVGADLLTLYYIPQSSLLLTKSEKEEFINSKKSYYITDNISIKKGNLIKATLEIKLEIYKEDEKLGDTIKSILDDYPNKFGVDLDGKKEEIKSLISKISTVKQILSLEYIYQDETGLNSSTSLKDFFKKDDYSEALSISYFSINFIFNTVLC